MPFLSHCTDPLTGLEHDVQTRVIEDACKDCNGWGVIHFSTFADYRECIMLRRWQEEANDPEDDYWHEPRKSGSRPCVRCNCTGHFPGDGGRIEVSLTWTGRIFNLPIGIDG